MRKWNAVISALILVLLLIHLVTGALVMMGLQNGGSAVSRVLACVMAGLVAAHAVIGVKLTADTLRLQKKSGTAYLKGNELFWARRISGLVMILLMLLHVAVFRTDTRGAVRLHPFGGPELIWAILLVLTIALHVLTNIRPLLISFGIAGFRLYVKDILFILTIVLLFAAAAFSIYYIRWNLAWRP